MMPLDNQLLQKAIEDVRSYRLRDAISDIKQFLAQTPYLYNNSELERIEADYELMLDYMSRGFVDPAREQIYHDLLRRLYRCIRNYNMAFMRKNTPFFMEVAKHEGTHVFTHEQIHAELEAFVTDVAMLSLEFEETRAEKSKEIYKRHHAFMSSLFCQIVAALQWTEADAVFFQQTLLSPTTDVIDAQLIVSAIMLSAMSNYDFLKFKTLLAVYRESTVVAVRQRALVGWVFSMGTEQALFPEQSRLIREVCENEHTVTDLVDMQKQLIFCMRADSDYEHISRDIMPTLMKNNHLNITRQGIITEKEDDPMEDIINPDAADRRMEEMEESIQKMISMQKAGSDIYFGGFSQMKRFPFFYTLSNWMVPFYVEHPGLSSVADKLRNRKFMSNLLEFGPFCNSDKYSFTLAMSSIIDRLPENLKSMLDNSEALGPVAPLEEQKSEAYVRRMYLQDLYRFFRLYPQKKGLSSIFDTEHYVFTASPVFTSTPLCKYYASLCMFFRKQKNEEAFGQLIHQYHDDNDVACKLMRATYYLDNHHLGMAREELDRLLELNPEHERGLLLAARVSFMSGHYEQALDFYERLYNSHPDNKNYALNYCLALCKTNDYEKAVALLYKLDFEHPDQPDIMRIQAWAFMGGNRLEQADKVYQRLLGEWPDHGGKAAEPSDYLNAGYCKWFQGDVKNAVAYFRHYAANEGVNLSEDFDNDADMMELYNITTTDVLLMLDLVCA